MVQKNSRKNKIIKIPRTIRINGYDWKIKDSGDYGASFDFKTLTITIPRGYKNTAECLLHEILEIILNYNHSRYQNNEENSEWLFNFNHTQFCNIVNNLYQVIKDNNLNFND